MSELVDSDALLPAETASEFWKVFSERTELIKAALNSDSNLSVDLVKAQRASFQSLQQYAYQSAGVLAPYDNKRAQESLDQVNRDIRTVEDKVQPKKTFKFSRGTTKTSAASAISLQSAPAPVSSEPIAAEKTTIPLPPGAYVLSGRSNESIEHLKSPIQDIPCQLLITHCSDCTFSLPFRLGSVRLEHLQRCRVYLGPCDTSVYLESVTDSVVYISAHQIRIHQTRATSLYLDAQSHPIIEDCDAIGVAPYDLWYEGIEKEREAAGLTGAGHWRDVIDFRWHKETVSPHWRELSPEERAAAPVFGGRRSQYVVVSQEAVDSTETRSIQREAEQTIAAPAAAVQVGDGQEEEDEL